MSRRRRAPDPETPALAEGETPPPPAIPRRAKRENSPAQQDGGSYRNGKLVERTQPDPDTVPGKE